MLPSLAFAVRRAMYRSLPPTYVLALHVGRSHYPLTALVDMLILHHPVHALHIQIRVLYTMPLVRTSSAPSPLCVPEEVRQ